MVVIADAAKRVATARRLPAADRGEPVRPHRHPARRRGGGRTRRLRRPGAPPARAGRRPPRHRRRATISSTRISARSPIRKALGAALWAVPGVVEHGLFLGIADAAILAAARDGHGRSHRSRQPRLRRRAPSVHRLKNAPHVPTPHSPRSASRSSLSAGGLRPGEQARADAAAGRDAAGTPAANTPRRDLFPEPPRARPRGDAELRHRPLVRFGAAVLRASRSASSAVTRPELAKDLDEVLPRLQPEMEMQKQALIGIAARTYAAQASPRPSSRTSPPSSARPPAGATSRPSRRCSTRWCRRCRTGRSRSPNT